MELNEGLRDSIVLFLNSQKYISEINLNEDRAGESVMDVIHFINNLGDDEVDLSEMSTNGWECDIFIPFEYNGNNFTLYFGAMYNKMKLFMEE